MSIKHKTPKTTPKNMEAMPPKSIFTFFGRRGCVVSQRPSQGITVVEWMDEPNCHWVDGQTPVNPGWA